MKCYQFCNIDNKREPGFNMNYEIPFVLNVVVPSIVYMLIIYMLK